MLPGRRDCYLLAAAQAVAARQPHLLTESIRECEAGILVGPPGTTPVLLTGNLNRWQGHTTDVTWPAAVEAGYAYARGGARVLLARGDPSDALSYLTGFQASTFAAVAGQAAFTQHLVALWMHGECIVLHSQTHAFAVVGVQMRSGTPTLQIMDPRRRWWQRSGSRTISWSPARHKMVAYSATQRERP